MLMVIPTFRQCEIFIGLYMVLLVVVRWQNIDNFNFSMLDTNDFIFKWIKHPHILILVSLKVFLIAEL